MKARIGGGELSFEVRGQGPPLLFLHAFPLGQAMWDGQAEALARRFQVVRFDARGFGGSPPGEGLLTMERIADDAALLLDHLGLSRAVVCGLSMGSHAALALVRRHADRLRALVLCSGRAGADSESARQARAELAEKVRRDGAAAAAQAMVPRLLGRTTQEQRPQVVARVRDMVLANPPRGIADALAGLAARADSTPTLREVRVPTLVLGGEEDLLTTPEEARRLHEGIAGSRLQVLPGAGHLMNMEDPPAFDAALHGFLAALG
ncbi:MAG TPA: alpha/beta fold hydrolase [Vicinamibacteria bacterium]|nr:alpha/beta fold hydrolase [Vicinamibacteria bacterium]